MSSRRKGRENSHARVEDQEACRCSDHDDGGAGLAGSGGFPGRARRVNLKREGGNRSVTARPDSETTVKAPSHPPDWKLPRGSRSDAGIFKLPHLRVRARPAGPDPTSPKYPTRTMMHGRITAASRNVMPCDLASHDDFPSIIYGCTNAPLAEQLPAARMQPPLRGEGAAPPL